MEAGGDFDVVRVATDADIPALVAMAGQFHATHERRFDFDQDHMAANFEAWVRSPACVVLVHAQGFIAGAVMPSASNPRWLAAYEILWWSEDGGGLVLMRAFEKWACDMNASEVKFSHPASNPTLPRVLVRLGHVPAEIAYTKGL